MKNRGLKRYLSSLLAMIMLISVIPVEVFATEVEDVHSHEDEIIIGGDEPIVENPLDLGVDPVINMPVIDSSDDLMDVGATDTELVSGGNVVIEKITTEPAIEEPEETVTEPAIEEPEEESGYSDEYLDAQFIIDDILTYYVGGTDKNDEEIDEIVSQMDSDTIHIAQMEIYDLEESVAEQLTEEEITTLVENNPVFVCFAETLDQYGTGVNLLASKTVTVLDGKISVTDSAGNGALSNGTITIKASGWLFGKGENSITIKNDSGSEVELKFDYGASSYSSFKIAGKSSTGSGSYSATLANDGTVQLYLQSKSGLSDTTATLTLSNFSLKEIADSSDVTVIYDNTLGSVSVNGSSVSPNTVIEGIGKENSISLIATVKSGVEFLGWVDTSDHSVISKSKEFSYKPTANVKVQAAFARDGATGWYGIGGASRKSVSAGLLGLSKLYYYEVDADGYLFDDLGEAAKAASASATNKTIVLMNNAVLAAGEYTIPSGVTLLIPFDSNNTMYTTEVVSEPVGETVNEQNVLLWKKPTEYRTLSLENGTKLIVEGAVSLSAKHCYANGGYAYGGSPTGDVSFVRMTGNSEIRVKKGGSLYAYGYITGSGNVIAEDGANVYENFQIMDFRGGTQSTDMKNGVFPFSQYYIQNIEVPLTLYSGAKEYSYTTIHMSASKFGSSIAFIAKDNSMFNLTSGYVTKRYDGSTDRLILDAYGNVTLSPINMTVGTSSINSKDFVLPINSNFTVRVHEGNSITIKQDLAFLPGSEIVIDKNAECILGDKINIYVYDKDQWGNYSYGAGKNVPFEPVGYAPSRTYIRTKEDLTDATVLVNGVVDVSKGYVYSTISADGLSGGGNVYTEGSGTICIGDGGDKTVTYQLVQYADYVEIPISPVKLKNEDGTFVTTVTGNYSYQQGRWSACGQNHDWKFKEPIINSNCKDEQNGQNLYVCSVCGVEKVEAVKYEHTLNEGEVVVPAKCFENGLLLKICTACGYEKTETIPQIGKHTLEKVQGKAATCEEDGYTEKEQCSVCGEVQVAALPIKKLGHEYSVTYDWAKDNSVCTGTAICDRDKSHIVVEVSKAIYNVKEEATHSSSGSAIYTAVFENDSFVEQTKEIVLDVMDHDYKEVVTDPTCTEEGYTTYNCDCGHSYTDDEKPALGHAGEKQNGLAAACVDDGHSEYWTCVTCGIHFEDADCTDRIGDGQALEQWKSIGGKGFKEHTGHAWNEGVVTVNPTCEEDGVKTFTCQNDENHTRTEAVSAIGHNGVHQDGRAYSCTEDGYKEYWLCNGCALYYSDEECKNVIGDADALKAWKETGNGNIPAKHHYTETKTAPTCTEDGYTTYTCSVCGPETENHTYRVGDEDSATGHLNIKETTKVPATCTTSGTKAFWTCEDCGIHFEDEECSLIIGKDDVLDEWLISEGKGYIPVLSHSTEHFAELPADCEVDGHKEYWYCGVCKTYFADEQYFVEIGNTNAKLEQWKTTDGKLDQTGHDWDEGEVTVEPNCKTETDGVRLQTCKNNESHTREVPEKWNHSLTGEYQVLQPPTCTQAGIGTNNHCSVCDGHWTETPIQPLGHNEVKKSGMAATCLVAGHKEHWFCDRCGLYYSDEECKNLIGDNEALEAWKTNEGKIEAAHTYEAEVTDPTCTKVGYTTYTCLVCKEGTTGHSYVVDGDPATGHNPAEMEALAKTCLNDGHKAYWFCDGCDTYYSEAECNAESIIGNFEQLTAWKTSGAGRIEAGHEYEAHVTEATCTTDAYTTYTCSECEEGTDKHSYIETAKGTAKGHDPVKTSEVEKTCLVDGHKAYWFCEACNTYFSAEECGENVIIGDADDLKTWKERGDGNIPKGHEYEAETTEPTCTTKGYTTYTCSVCEDGAEGHIKVDNETPALGHKNVESMERLEATCVANGFCEHWYCPVCKTYFSNEECTVIIGDEAALTAWKAPEGEGFLKAKGHSYGEGIVTKATCTTGGFTTYTCDVCPEGTAEKVKVEDETSALGHQNVEVTALKEATCVSDGCKAFWYCPVCKTYFSNEECTAVIGDEGALTAWKSLEGNGFIKSNGHTYGEGVVTAPTCTEDGYTTYTCTVCEEGTNDHVKVDHVVQATGHMNVSRIPAVAAACVIDGYRDHWYCESCETYFSNAYCTNEIGDAEDLRVWKTSERMGLLKAPGHSYGDGVVTKPTCDTDGSTLYICSICEEEYVTDVIAANGHKWDTEFVSTLPTCIEDGVRTFICSVCYGSKTEIEPALGHDIEQVEAKNPTYTMVGWEAYEWCQRLDCGYSTYKQIPKLPRPSISDFDTFMENLLILEFYANEYVNQNPGKDPAMLMIKYIRTGVERYNTGSWNMMAGYEDKDFADYVSKMEDQHNSQQDNVEDMIIVTSLKDLDNMYLPNGEISDIGHMFGMMDIAYTNIKSINHEDVSGWSGDLVDLLSLSDQFGVTGQTLNAMISQIENEYFLEESFPEEPIEGKFSLTDLIGDLDGYYVIRQLKTQEYEPGMIYDILNGYLTNSLTMEKRADYLLKNRLGGVTNRDDIREAVYEAYTGNAMIKTLEATREFNVPDLTDMRRACCYVFADYLWKLAGDTVEEIDNRYYSTFSTEKSTLAPGITQTINKATTADNKQVVYYTATADITRDYINVYANYNENDPEKGWAMSRVIDQAEAAQKKYGDPNSEDYIENYSVIASINGAGFNMTTGEPGGLLVMGGTQYHEPNADGFFGILDDGTAMIGTTAEYKKLHAQGKVKEAIAGFGSVLVKDGKIVVAHSNGYTNDRASRTAVGITKTGKVVFLVVDGRQEPVSCGGSMQEIAQMMLEAGCYNAVNLDGGGSTTYVAKQEGDEKLSVANRPSDGYSRSVSTSLMMVSTAPSSNEFHHAVLEADNIYLTAGAETTLSAAGVSPMGNAVDIPNGAVWAVADETKGSITADGTFTADGTYDPAADDTEVEVNLVLNNKVVGTTTLHVVKPTGIYFNKDRIDAVYSVPKEMPLKALYNGKDVKFLPTDVTFSMSNASAGTMDGLNFIGNSESNLDKVTLTAALKNNPAVKDSIMVFLYDKSEYSFDFDSATGGDRQLAFNRVVSNSTTVDKINYNVVDRNKAMVTTYTFGIDMTQIPIPDRLAGLVYMLPGADVEGASAWTFLLQLAERISPLSEVRPKIRFDKDMIVDYSNVSLVCEYFTLTDTIFNEETNELTLVLNWIDQTEPIPVDTANPNCVVSGITLTPKNTASWDSKDRLSVTNSGEISYKICMRASALVSFSRDPENQKIYGLYPYENPNPGMEKDKGAYFGDVYKEFEDKYTLSKGFQEGWIHEGTGYAYYVNGEKLTGVHKIGDYYYDFGENGINVGQTKFTGVFEDVGGLRFIRVGVPVVPGWHTDMDKSYHVHEDGFAYLAKVDNPMTCVRGGYNTYTCLDSNCKKVETVGDFQTPKGHDWDENYKCRICDTVGINITGAAIGFGTLKEPINMDGIVRYYYSSGGVRPWIYATFDGKTELSWSGDGNVDKYGYVKDLYVTWPNNNGIGNAFVEINGRGNYYGKVTLRYQIIPRDVQNLRATNITDGAVTLAWDKALGAHWYELYDNQNGVRKYIATIPEGTSVTLTGIEEGRVYNFQVISVAKSTDGEDREYACAYWSNTVTIPESAAKPTTPSNPPASRPSPGGGGGTLDVPVKVEVKQELEPEVTVDRTGKVEFQVGDVAIKNGVQYAVANDSPVVEINPIVKGDAKEMTTIISLESVKELKSNDVGVAVSSPVAGITVKSEALKLVDGDLELTAVKNNDGTVTISTTVDGKAKDLKDVTVTIPFGKNVAEKDNKFNVLVEVHEDGTETVIKKSVVNSDGVAAIVDSNATVKVAQVEKEFPDTEGHWGESAIDFVAARGIFSGTGKGFEPNGTMTRAMIVTTLYHLEDAIARGTHSFPDVPSGTWYSDPVTWAARERIVSGTGKGFEPNVNITRQQLAVILYNYAKYVGMDTSARGDLAKYNDKAKVAGWATEAMEWAIGSGLISGMGNNTLNPQGNATRAQAAVIYEKLIKQMVKN